MTAFKKTLSDILQDGNDLLDECFTEKLHEFSEGEILPEESAPPVEVLASGELFAQNQFLAHVVSGSLMFADTRKEGAILRAVAFRAAVDQGELSGKPQPSDMAEGLILQNEKLVA